MGGVLAMTLCGTGIAAEDPIPVELWRRGHDVLRAKFHAAVEDALSSSPDFTLTSEGVAGNLVVTAPTHLEWKKRSGGLELFIPWSFLRKMSN